MQIEVSKKDLQQTLKFVAATVAKTDSDLSGHYLFRVSPKDDTVVEVLTYDGKTTSLARLNCKLTPPTDGVTSFTFEARRLDMWLTGVPDAALTLEHHEGKTTAFSPLGEQTFESLDPEKFPTWDAVLEASTKTVAIKANRLKEMLSFVRPFTYADETKQPGICQAQFRNGYLYATDTSTAVAVQMVGMDEAGFSISSKNLSSLLSFLGQCGDGEVEIREHERLVSYHLGTSAIYGESRMVHNFPLLNLGLDKPNQHTWKINREEVTKVLNFLLSAAPKDHEHLIFQPDTDTTVKMGMAVAAGGTKHIPIACEFLPSLSDATPLTPKGFKVRYPHLVKALTASGSDVVTVGVNAKGSGGWLRLYEERDGDKYFTIVQWSN